MIKMLIGTENDYQYIILKAKKEVFDDIWKIWAKKYGDNHTSNEAIFDMHDVLREVEKRHLSTSQSKGAELSFKVPSQSSDKILCPKCRSANIENGVCSNGHKISSLN